MFARAPLFCLVIFAIAIPVPAEDDNCDAMIRWCYTGTQANGGYEQYDGVTYSCILCGGTYSLKTRREMEILKCCPEGTLKDKCYEGELRCEDGGYFNDSQVCDGVKNCVDGSDEAICIPGRIFSCGTDRSGNEQSVEMNKVCDGAKDCFNGLDETTCTYFGGRCDGFRCAKREECVQVTAVCDGVKDCWDGTDETNCTKDFGKDQFKCSENGRDIPIKITQVCDGTEDCDSGEDEKNCFQWTQWSKWSGCECISTEELPVETKRTRCCMALNSNIHMEGMCMDGAKEQVTPCDCATGNTTKPDENLVVVTVIPLTIILVLLVGFFIVHLVIKRKNAWHSYSEATLSLALHANTESLQSPIMTEMVNYNQGSNEHSAKFPQDRRLPATPPGEAGRYANGFPTIMLGGRLSFHEAKEDSGMTVENPLYKQYTEDDTTYHSLANGRLQVTPKSVSYESCEVASQGGERHSSSEFGDVFEEENTDNSRSSIMEQIEIAQMGNLIEVTDVRLKSIG